MVKPQLAKKYEGGIDSAMYAEPKIDGLRGLIILDSHPKIVSRTGKRLLNHDHLLAPLMRNYRKAMPNGKGIVIDGEFYAGCWETTMTACRKANAAPDAVFWAFDAIPLADFKRGRSDFDQTVRRMFLTDIVKGVPGVKLTPQETVHSSAQVMAAYKKWFQKGFEGVMLKDPYAGYKGGRSPSWLKVKGAKEGDYKIIGFQEGTGKYRGMLGALFISVGGRKGKVGTGFTDEQRESFWRRQRSLLGKWVQVGYQEKTGSGNLRFPRFVRLRLDK